MNYYYLSFSFHRTRGTAVLPNVTESFTKCTAKARVSGRVLSPNVQIK